MSAEDQLCQQLTIHIEGSKSDKFLSQCEMWCRATASSVAEAKDAELERVLGSNARLRQDLASLQHLRMVCPSCLTFAHFDSLWHIL